MSQQYAPEFRGRRASYQACLQMSTSTSALKTKSWQKKHYSKRRSTTTQHNLTRYVSHKEKTQFSMVFHRSVSPDIWKHWRISFQCLVEHRLKSCQVQHFEALKPDKWHPPTELDLENLPCPNDLFSQMLSIIIQYLPNMIMITSS